MRLGDVFTVPLGDGRVVVGQAVACERPGRFHLALFEGTFPSAVVGAIDDALCEPIAFLVLSTDAGVRAGRWPVVANRLVDPDVPLPAYKAVVGRGARVDVVDHDGRRRRPARGAEAGWLPTREVVSPAALERVIRARHGLEPWDDAYRRHEPNQVATSARLFGD